MKKRNWDIYQMEGGTLWRKFLYASDHCCGRICFFGNSKIEEFGNYGSGKGILSADIPLEGIWDLFRQIQFWRGGVKQMTHGG